VALYNKFFHGLLISKNIWCQIARFFVFQQIV